MRVWLHVIGDIQGVQITLVAFHYLLDVLLQFVRRDVFVSAIHGLELAAIDGHCRITE